VRNEVRALLSGALGLRHRDPKTGDNTVAHRLDCSYIPLVMVAGRFVWDERKRTANLRKHGIDFAIVERFEFDSAVITAR
jgi:hypothetical protein